MRIRSLITLFVFIIACFPGRAQTIITGGYVSGTWDSDGSPYIIQGPVIIHSDSALNIEAGSILEFYDSAYLLVNGYIAAGGTPSDSIIFRSAQNTWQGIRMGALDSNYQDNHLFYYCIFEDAYSTLSPGGGAMAVINRDDVTIFHSRFSNNYSRYNGGALYLDSASIQLKNTDFISNQTAEGPDVYRGGAVYVIGVQMILDDVNFIDNHSVIAGAMYSDRSSLELRNSSYTGNTSVAGGGALVCHNAGLYGFTNCIFEGNRAGGSGGAIALLEMIVGRFKNCTIRNNSAKSDIYYASGGGVLVTPYDNVVSFVNCRIENNLAGDYGGGVYAGTKTDFISSLLINNRASTDTMFESGGGAIYMFESENTILNCTFVNNDGDVGTTILSEDAIIGMVNTILWDDSAGADAKIYLASIEDTPSIHVSNSDIKGGEGVIRGSGDFEVYWGKGNIEADPLFEIPGTDFRLSDDSPCIDTGRLDTLLVHIPFTDLAGNPRVFRDSIDMGCYENQTSFGIPEFTSHTGIKVYPNPARDQFFVENISGSDLYGDVQLVDFRGRIVREEKVYLSIATAIQINISNLPAGIYLLRLVHADEVSNLKFLIQK